MPDEAVMVEETDSGQEIKAELKSPKEILEPETVMEKVPKQWIDE